MIRYNFKKGLTNLSKTVDIIIKDWYIDNNTEANGVKLC